MWNLGKSMHFVPTAWNKLTYRRKQKREKTCILMKNSWILRTSFAIMFFSFFLNCSYFNKHTSNECTICNLYYFTERSIYRLAISKTINSFSSSRDMVQYQRFTYDFTTVIAPLKYDILFKQFIFCINILSHLSAVIYYLKY